jgi:hypothetical protein
MEQVTETGQWNIPQQEKSIKSLIPKLHEKYPEIHIKDMEKIIDYCFVQLFRYIRNLDDIRLIFSLDKKIAGFSFIRMNKNNQSWLVKKRARYNYGRTDFFKAMRIYRKYYGKTERTEYF